MPITMRVDTMTVDELRAQHAQTCRYLDVLLEQGETALDLYDTGVVEQRDYEAAQRHINTRFAAAQHREVVLHNELVRRGMGGELL